MGCWVLILHVASNIHITVTQEVLGLQVPMYLIVTMTIKLIVQTQVLLRAIRRISNEYVRTTSIC